jgi:flagellar biogenesis protein FliO
VRRMSGWTIVLAVAFAAMCGGGAVAAQVGPGVEVAPQGSVAQQLANAASEAPSSVNAAATGRPVGVPSRERQPLLVAKPADGATAAAAAASVQGPVERSTLGEFAAMGLPLLAVLVLIVGCAWVFRKVQASSRGAFGGSSGAITSPSGIVSILGRYSLNTVGSSRQNILLLQVDRRILLLGQTLPARGQPGSLSTLCELAEPEDVASILIKVSEAEQTGPASRFSAMLSSAGDDQTHRLGGVGRLLARLKSRSDRPVSWSEQHAQTQVREVESIDELRTQPSVAKRLKSITAQAHTRQTTKRGVA